MTDQATDILARRRPRVAVVDDMPIGGGVLGAMLSRLGCEIVPYGVGEDGASRALRTSPDVIFASLGCGPREASEASNVGSHPVPLVSYGTPGRLLGPDSPALPSAIHIEEPLRLVDVSRALEACLAMHGRIPARGEPSEGVDVERSIAARAWNGLAGEIAAFRIQDLASAPAECARLAHRVVSSASILGLRDLTSACVGFESCWAKGLDLGLAHARVLGAMAAIEGIPPAGTAGHGWTGDGDAIVELLAVDPVPSASW